MVCAVPLFVVVGMWGVLAGSPCGDALPINWRAGKRRSLLRRLGEGCEGWWGTLFVVSGNFWGDIIVCLSSGGWAA